MNKFGKPEEEDFLMVCEVIKDMAEEAAGLIVARQQGKYLDKRSNSQHQERAPREVLSTNCRPDCGMRRSQRQLSNRRGNNHSVEQSTDMACMEQGPLTSSMRQKRKMPAEESADLTSSSAQATFLDTA